MHLQRNDMLSTDVGGAPRARRSCYVDEPAYGFFIAGSSIREMNGIFVRRAPPKEEEEEEEEEEGDEDKPRKHLLYYAHMDSGWTMSLCELKEDRPSSMSHYWKEEENEWLFIDPAGGDRFKHKGNTIVPGAGISWKHLHRSNKAAEGGGGGSARRLGGDIRRGSQIVKADDNEDELPWQVIAVLDYDILRQLVGGAEYHKQKMSEAKAGRGVVEAPALTSLEGCYQAGCWVYRVLSADGVPIVEHPSDDARPCGRLDDGDHVKVAEISADGKWLKLQVEARGYYAARRTFDQWVALKDASSGAALLERVELADLANTVLEGETQEEAEKEASASEEAKAAKAAKEAGGAAAEAAKRARVRSSLAAEFLDQPFVPRLEEDAAVAEGSSGGGGAAMATAEGGDADLADIDMGEGEPAELAAAAASALAAAAALPIGALVVVFGLSSLDARKYNGTKVRASTAARAHRRAASSALGRIICP